MSKKNDDFFKAKKEWSTVKDDILACYFKPYVSKILHTNKPLFTLTALRGKESLMMAVPVPLLLP